MSQIAEPTPGELVIVTGMTGAGRSTAAKAPGCLFRLTFPRYPAAQTAPA